MEGEGRPFSKAGRGRRRLNLQQELRKLGRDHKSPWPARWQRSDEASESQHTLSPGASPCVLRPFLGAFLAVLTGRHLDLDSTDPQCIRQALSALLSGGSGFDPEASLVYGTRYELLTYRELGSSG